MPKSIFVLDDSECIGCGNCVVVCKAQSHLPEIMGGKGPNTSNVVFRIENGKVKLCNEGLCERNQGKKCRVCIDACPLDLIQFRDLEET